MSLNDWRNVSSAILSGNPAKRRRTDNDSGQESCRLGLLSRLDRVLCRHEKNRNGEDILLLHEEDSNYENLAYDLLVTMDIRCQLRRMGEFTKRGARIFDLLNPCEKDGISLSSCDKIALFRLPSMKRRATTVSSIASDIIDGYRFALVHSADLRKLLKEAHLRGIPLKDDMFHPNEQLGETVALLNAKLNDLIEPVPSSSVSKKLKFHEKRTDLQRSSFRFRLFS